VRTAEKGANLLLALNRKLQLRLERADATQCTVGTFANARDAQLSARIMSQH
jgi:hypothetical protein